jgi:hypothetical protein
MMLKRALSEIDKESVEKSSLKPDVKSLQSFIDQLLIIYQEKFWTMFPLLRFLDNVAEKSFIVELQLFNLSQQVRFLCSVSHLFSFFSTIHSIFFLDGAITKAYRRAGTKSNNVSI